MFFGCQWMGRRHRQLYNTIQCMQLWYWVTGIYTTQCVILYTQLFNTYNACSYDTGSLAVIQCNSMHTVTRQCYKQVVVFQPNHLCITAIQCTQLHSTIQREGVPYSSQPVIQYTQITQWNIHISQWFWPTLSVRHSHIAPHGKISQGITAQSIYVAVKFGRPTRQFMTQCGHSLTPPETSLVWRDVTFGWLDPPRRKGDQTMAKGIHVVSRFLPVERVLRLTRIKISLW